MKALHETLCACAAIKEESTGVKDKLQAAEQAAVGVLGDVERMESVRRRSQAAAERLYAEAGDCAASAARTGDYLAANEKSAAAIRTSVRELKAQAADLQTEMSWTRSSRRGRPRS
jgi:hypothetical protein